MLLRVSNNLCRRVEPIGWLLSSAAAKTIVCLYELGIPTLMSVVTASCSNDDLPSAMT
jgi:hypothetical protein